MTDEKKLKAKLLEWNEALDADIRKATALGDNRAYQFALGCQSMIYEVLKLITEEDHEQGN